MGNEPKNHRKEKSAFPTSSPAPNMASTYYLDSSKKASSPLTTKAPSPPSLRNRTTKASSPLGITAPTVTALKAPSPTLPITAPKAPSLTLPITAPQTITDPPLTTKFSSSSTPPKPSGAQKLKAKFRGVGINKYSIVDGKPLEAPSVAMVKSSHSATFRTEDDEEIYNMWKSGKLEYWVYCQHCFTELNLKGYVPPFRSEAAYLQHFSSKHGALLGEKEKSIVTAQHNEYKRRVDGNSGPQEAKKTKTGLKF